VENKSLGSPQTMGVNVSFSIVGQNFIATIINPKQDILQWLPALCDYTVNKEINGYAGELKFKKSIHSFSISQKTEKESKVTLTVNGVKDNDLLFLLKRIVYKTAYCVQCEVCEVDCPTGALSILPKVNINRSKCIHCHKCLNTHDRGCIAADCIRMIKDTDKKMNTKLQGYKTFGLREDWVNEYFLNLDGFWQENSLGTAQVDSVKAWLRDAEITDTKHILTPMGELMKDIYEFSPQMFWEIAFINLTYNSGIVSWFVSNIGVGQTYDKKTLADAFAEQGYNGSMATLKNAIAALIDLMKKSLIGDTLNQCHEKERGEMCRGSYDGISEEAVTYSLYKYAREQGINTLRVADIYNSECTHGISKEFCLPKMEFERILRQLSLNETHVLNAELNMGLDHITLRDDLNALTALKLLLGV